MSRTRRHTCSLMLTARAPLLFQARQLQVKVRGDLKPFGIRLCGAGQGAPCRAWRPLVALVAPMLSMRAALLAPVRNYEREIKRQAAADVPAAFGLVPRIGQSGEYEHIGSSSITGDVMMRSLLFKAANALLTRTRRSFALERWGAEAGPAARHRPPPHVGRWQPLSPHAAGKAGLVKRMSAPETFQTLRRQL